jgi:hypothetical protein
MIPPMKNSTRHSTLFSNVYRKVAILSWVLTLMQNLDNEIVMSSVRYLALMGPAAKTHVVPTCFPSTYPMASELRILFSVPSHYTFTNINNGKQTMIDVFECSQQLHCQVHNCRITLDGVESNHSAVRLDLTMTSLKHKTSTTLARGTIDWCKIASNTATNEHYKTFSLHLLK